MALARPYFRRLYATSATSAAYSDTIRAPVINGGVSKQVNLFEINAHLKGLVLKGCLVDARKLFDELPQRDTITWTTIISAYVKVSDSSQALCLFGSMWSGSGLRMDPFILSLALKACGLNVNAKCGMLLHSLGVKSGLVDSVFVGSSILDMYTKVGKVSEGCQFFDEMPLRNVVSWTAMITGLVRSGFHKDGLMYFSEMWKDGVEYEAYSFAIALKACANIGFLNHGREIHAQTIKKGVDVTSYVINSLAMLYSKCGKLKYGLHLFEKMSHRDVVSWTSVISNYVQIGNDIHGINAFLQMRESNVKPNEYTFSAVIAACANVIRHDWGAQLHAHIIHIGLEDSLSVANSLMALYSKCGQLSSASTVFQCMSRMDVVSWSTIISGYAQGGCGEEAFEFLSKMRREGPKPTEFAYGSVLSACGSMAILDQGKQLHSHVLTIGLDHRAMVRSGLINMYSKCGSIGDASKIFCESENDDIISWTAMINGFAEHGYSQEAIDLFEKIPEAGLRPDSVTFIGVLSACSHVGLVDLGYHYFNSLSKEYTLNPSKQHYGCMIDLLCRAGRLNEAENMITTMPFERDDVVWSSLLRACRVHGDVERGKRAAEQILKLDPSCAGTHITLANLYASKGKYRESAEVRKQLKSKGIIKEPGWSWIKVKEQVSAFVAGDRVHPQAEAVYKILELVASVANFSQKVALHSQYLED
ncbi:hypothetical protein LIER_11316 [Lithospermum erythrorhizon]|uniref:Pentatricopeptide repeat-containing protein n=1 Tax=Lithospermum erythrorhizon TaxID=34254 RepID=A0AAV3PMX2_LITER